MGKKNLEEKYYIYKVDEVWKEANNNNSVWVVKGLYMYTQIYGLGRRSFLVQWFD